MGFFDSIKQMFGWAPEMSPELKQILWDDDDNDDGVDLNDPTDYNDEIIITTNQVTNNMNDMNAAMDANDFAKAEKVRLQWKEDLKSYQKEIDEIGAFRWNDRMLLDAATSYLKSWDNLMDNGYKTLIEMRTAGKRWTPEEQAQLKANNDEIQRFTAVLNDVGDEFLEKYEDD